MVFSFTLYGYARARLVREREDWFRGFCDNEISLFFERHKAALTVFNEMNAMVMQRPKDLVSWLEIPRDEEAECLRSSGLDS